MVVDDDHLVGMAEPLLREDADGRRAAADAHPLLVPAADDRRLAGLEGQLLAAVDGEVDRVAVRQAQHHIAGDDALLLRAAGEMADAAEREHLGAVFRRRDMADLLALDAHRRGLRPDIAVGVDLHLEAAIAEDAFGNDRHHVDTLMLAGDDEGRGLVVRIGRAGADAGDEGLGVGNQRTVPVLALEGYEVAVAAGALGDHERVHPGQRAVDIAVAVAGAGAPFADAAQDRTGIAGDDARLVLGGCRCSVRHGRPPARRAGRRGPGAAAPARGAGARRSHDGPR